MSRAPTSSPDQHCQVGRDRHHPALEVVVELSPVLSQGNDLWYTVFSVFPKPHWRCVVVHQSCRKAMNLDRT